MKQYFYTSIIVLLPMIFSAQLKIIEQSNPTVNVDGELLNSNGNASDFELDVDLSVVNEGSTDITLWVKRTEIDVVPSTENATCWSLCPSPIVAGTEVVQISAFSVIIPAGDTNFSFAAHYYPKNIDGCSLFKYEWVEDGNLTVPLASVSIRFSHTFGICTVGVEEVDEDVSFSISPNPAKQFVSISMNEVENFNGLSIEVYDMLGKKVGSYSQLAANNTINIENYKKGIYFVSIMRNGILAKTMKLIKD